MIMDDKLLYNRKKQQTITNGLQDFIDSMVEKIVLEGKPFNSVKKYQREYRNNKGLGCDYNYNYNNSCLSVFLQL